jgi:hypothetical protein
VSFWLVFLEGINSVITGKYKQDEAEPCKLVRGE